MRFLVTTCAMLSALFLGSCAGPTTAVSAWEHFDSCSGETPFAAVVECGKRKRTAYCQTVGGCSPTGNAFVEYADSLVVSVERRKMTEAEALRRFTGSYDVCRPEKGGS
jgi:hypothetical protein